MKKPLSLFFGAILFCSFLSAKEAVKIIDFYGAPDSFITAVKELANTRYSVFFGDRARKTEAIFGDLYSLVYANDALKEQSVALVKKQLNFPGSEPEMLIFGYGTVLHELKKLLGVLSSENKQKIFDTLSTNDQKNRLLGVIAYYEYHQYFGNKEDVIQPREFIDLLLLDIKTLESLIQLDKDLFKKTIFEVMAQKALGKKGTVEEWLKPMVKEYEASTAIFKDFASGINVIV